MLIASASRTAAVAHTAFPAFSAPTSSTLARSGAASLPRFVIRQRRHSSSNKHSSRAKQQQQPPVASGAEEQRAARADGSTQPPQQQTQATGNKRGARALKKAGANVAQQQQQQQAKEKETGKQGAAASSQGQQNAASKTADASVTDVQAQLDSVAMPPSVPSTAHVDHKVVYLAKLFAQHRPISLNQPLPPQDGKAAFDNIFAPASAKKKAQEVLFTLASAVKSLESAAASSGANSNSGVKVVTPSAFDQSPTTSQAATINLEELAKNFRPFNAPPAPMPLDPRYLDQHHQVHQNPPAPTKRPRKAIAVPTAAIEPPPMPEGIATDIADKGNGDGNATTSIAPSYRGRMRLRHGEWLATWIRRMRDAAMQLISVKRQRKIKMKKHKKKKLMKRTRNLRRRLDRL